MINTETKNENQTREVIKYLTATFKSITKNKLRLFRRLPFYLAINDDHAGAECLFTESDLDFLPTPHQNLELGKWHVSNQAVILNLNSQQPESGQWMGLLKFLRKFRRFKTLNGIIISLNFPQFVIQSESVTTEYLKELSKIIDMLYQQFKYPIPLYFIFTQINAIAGFNELFADLNAEQRGQAWGINVSTKDFEKEFDQLIATINMRLFVRLEAEKKIEQRAKIVCFPQQIALCKPSLKQLILQTNKLFVRGIYFVGSSETAKTYNFAMMAMAMRFGIFMHQPSHSVSAHNYFSKKILSQLILKDIDIIQCNGYFEKTKNIIKQFRWSIALFIFGISSAGLSVSYAHNSESIDTMMQILPKYRQAYTALTSSDTSLQAPLDTLNLLNSMKKINTYFLGYEPSQINNRLNNAFQELLSTQLMPRVLFQLENILKDNANNPEVLYEALKAYLAFSPIAEPYPEWIKPPIQNYININYSNFPNIKLEMNQYLNQALTYPVDSLALNQALIEKTREQLKKIPPALFAYHELKSQSEISQDQYRLDQEIQSDFNAVFIYKNFDQTGIPILFTLKGFLSLHDKNAKNFIFRTANVYQILGLSNNASSDLVTEMNPQVWRYYNQDYISAWNQYLSNIQIGNFENLNQAIQMLNLLTQPHNPLSEVLRKIADNTAVIKNSHTALYAFIGLPGKSSTQYKSVIKNLAALRDYLSNLSTSPNVSQAEFQDASAYLQNKLPNNPIAILKRQAQQLPFPLNVWINNIADNSFNLLLQGAHQVINTAWQNTVIPDYQTNIENRFPFGQQSDTYVNLSSFGNFFSNGGVFSKFFQIYLSTFINTSNTTWAEYKIGPYSLGLSPAVMTQLEQANKIRILYFSSSNNKNPSINFSIQPRMLDLQSKSIYLQLANQSFIYRHGPQQIFNWRWPATDNTQQVNVSFNDFSGKTSSITLDGPWAWFSLLNSTQLQPAGAPGHYIWTINQAGHQASFDVWVANNQPVFNLEILQNLNLPLAI